MNPMHHGDLLTSGTESKLPEQAASVLQNLTNETSLSLSGGRAQTMLPTRTPRTCQALLSTRTRAGSPVHPTTPISHCRCSTLLAFSCLGTASRGSTWVSGRVAVLQPSRPAASLRTVIIRLHYCCSRISHCSGVVLVYWPHDGLPAFMDVDVFHNHLLLALASIAAQRFGLNYKSTHELRSPVEVYLHSQIRLILPCRSPHARHCQGVDRDHLCREHSLQ